jgi:hypothetical protein
MPGRPGLALGLIAAGLTACGEDPAETAFERCKYEVARALDASDAPDFPKPDDLALREDPVYGWHLDIDVEAGAAGRRRRAGYRCLFEVAGRETPLFLAVLER